MSIGADAKVWPSEIQNATTPELPFLGNDIRYTKEQIGALGEMGMDTEGMIETPNSPQGTGIHISTFARNFGIKYLIEDSAKKFLGQTFSRTKNIVLVKTIFSTKNVF